MVIKVYVSTQSGSMEIKKCQENVLSIISSKKIDHEVIDISDPSNEDAKKWMWENGTVKEGQRRPLPPQIFNDDTYCGDYEAFSEAVETEEISVFLKLDSQKKRADKTEGVDINDNKQVDDEVSNALNIE